MSHDYGMRLRRLVRLLVLATALCIPLAILADDAARSDQARQQLSKLRERIASVRKQIDQDSDQRSDLSEALARAQSRISRTRKQLGELEDQIQEHKQRIKRLEEQRNDERDQLSDELQSLGTQVRAAYETGRMSRMRLLLSGTDPERIGRMLNYYQYFAKAQSKQVKSLKKGVARLASKQKSLENERAQLDKQRQSRADTLASLKASERKQKATLAALDERLGSGHDSLEDMQRQSQRLQKLLGSVQDQLADMPAVKTGDTFPNLKGQMKPPVKAQRILASFGQAKGNGALRWQGEWLAAPQGTPIRAVAGGRVVYVGYMKSYGLITIIDHGQGYYSLYGHAQTSYVDVGDAVSTGQTIGTAGHSGGHSSNGVYLEIRQGAKPVNPRHWLSG